MATEEEDETEVVDADIPSAPFEPTPIPPPPPGGPGAVDGFESLGESPPSEVLDNAHGQLALAKLWVILRPMLEGCGCQAERGGAACKRERKAGGGMGAVFKYAFGMIVVS